MTSSGPSRTPFYTPPTSPLPSSPDERPLSPVEYPDVLPDYEETEETHYPSIPTTSTLAQPFLTTTSSPPSRSELGTPENPIILDASTRPSTPSSSSIRSSPPSRRYSPYPTTTQLLLESRRETANALRLNNERFDQVLRRIEDLEYRLGLHTEHRESTTQTEVSLPPPIARTSYEPVTYRDVTVVVHQIDDYTNEEVSETSIYASSLRVYRRPVTGTVHRIDVRERIITRPRQGTH